MESHLVDKLLVSFEKEISLLQSLHAIDYPKLKYDVDLNKTSMVKFRKDHSRITRRPLLYKSGSMLYFPATGFPNAPSIELETREILSLIVKHLTEIGSSLNDILLVTIYIKNMTEFPLLNKIYNEFFNIPNPPARVTVSACIESNIEIEFIATTNPKLAMHVQSHSYWAPANIGPYSQVNSVLDQVYCAGQIPLIPSSMKLVVCDDLQSTLNNQVFLSLQHVSAILDPVKSSILQIVYGICYITDLNYISLAEEYWLERTEKAAVCFVVVDQLPRDAFVEWHVVSSTSTYTCRFNHNNEVVGSIFGSVAGFFIHLKRDLEFFDEKLAIVGHEVEWSNIVFGRVFYTSLVTAEMLQELMAKLSSVGCEAVSFVPCAYLDEKIVTVLLQFQVDK